MIEDAQYAVEVNNLSASYNDKPVLLDINLKIPKAALMAVVGPNGAGKSTLIKSMLDLIKPVSGKVSFMGRDYKSERKNIAYVPQSESVDWSFPADVLDVVLMGRYGLIGWIKRPLANDKEKAIDALKKVGMEEFTNRQIGMLSGGQRQRVFIARALVQDAEIYLLDEPFQGVDAKTEEAIISLLKDLRERGKTVIVVHHDLQTVPEYFDYVTLLNKEIIASGLVTEVFTDENLNKAYKIPGKTVKGGD